MSGVILMLFTCATPLVVSVIVKLTTSKLLKVRLPKSVPLCAVSVTLSTLVAPPAPLNV